MTPRAASLWPSLEAGFITVVSKGEVATEIPLTPSMLVVLDNQGMYHCDAHTGTIRDLNSFTTRNVSLTPYVKRMCLRTRCRDDISSDQYQSRTSKACRVVEYQVEPDCLIIAGSGA